MKILHLTDLHFRKHWFEWATTVAHEFDVVCISGDFLDIFDARDLQTQIAWVSDWMRSFPAKLVTCTGNHCWWPSWDANDENGDGKWLRRLASSQITTDGQTTVIGEVQFTSVGWMSPPNAPTLALPQMIIAHCGPRGSGVAHNGRRDLGEILLRDLVHEHPAIVLSGHVHDPVKWHGLVGKSVCFNPGFEPDASQPRHVRLDLKTRTAELVVNGTTIDTVNISSALGGF